MGMRQTVVTALSDTKFLFAEKSIRKGKDTVKEKSRVNGQKFKGEVITLI
jgi:hypothetical protein